MNAQEIQAKLAVRPLSLFGSTARGEADERSDMDLLVEFDRIVGLFHVFSVQHLFLYATT